MNHPTAELTSELNAVLIAWSQGQPPTEHQLQQLADWALNDAPAVWGLSAENVNEALRSRANLLQSFCGTMDSRRAEFPLAGHWADWIVPMWRIWLPLAQRLDLQQRALGAPFVQGILGGQGTGKSTLTQILQMILQQLGHQTVGLSIDDLYLTYDERQALQRQDPRLVWRGPPGTHDVDLGLQVLNAIKQADAKAQIELPQFDKSLYAGQGDRTSSIRVAAPTIAFFEGWFVGARPVADAVFERAQTPLPDPIITDTDKAFARDCNQKLRSYLPLWDTLNSLIVLCPEDYRLSQQWRQAAEHGIKAQGKPGLSDRDIKAFVTYFWKALHPDLFISPLTLGIHPNSSGICPNLVINIRSDHSMGSLRVA